MSTWDAYRSHSEIYWIYHVISSKLKSIHVGVWKVSTCRDKGFQWLYMCNEKVMTAALQMGRSCFRKAHRCTNVMTKILCKMFVLSPILSVLNIKNCNMTTLYKQAFSYRLAVFIHSSSYQKYSPTGTVTEAWKPRAVINRLSAFTTACVFVPNLVWCTPYASSIGTHAPAFTRYKGLKGITVIWLYSACWFTRIMLGDVY